MLLGNDERSKKFSKKSSNHPPLVIAEMMSVRTNKATLNHFLSKMNEDLLEISNGKMFNSSCFFFAILYTFISLYFKL